MTTTTTAAVQTRRTHQRPSVVELAKEYAVLILTGLILVILAFASPSFFTFPNLVNILRQRLAIALGLTVATGNVALGLTLAPVIGLILGAVNGTIITRLRIHSFLATLATSMVYTAVAVLITGGSLITVTIKGFSALGR